jgi:hypothetical protein
VNKNDDLNTVNGTITPKLQYVRRTRFISWYALAAIPVLYAPVIKDTETACFARLGLGGSGLFGFSAGLDGTFVVYPVRTYTGMSISLDYQYGSFGAEIEMNTNKNFTIYTTDARFELYIKQFTFWIGFYIQNTDSAGDLFFNPYIGIKYSL